MVPHDESSKFAARVTCRLVVITLMELDPDRSSTFLVPMDIMRAVLMTLGLLHVCVAVDDLWNWSAIVVRVFA